MRESKVLMEARYILSFKDFIKMIPTIFILGIFAILGINKLFSNNAHLDPYNLMMIQFGYDPFSGFYMSFALIPIIFFVVFAIIAITIFKMFAPSGSTIIEPVSQVIQNATSTIATPSQKEAVVLDSIPDVCPNCGAHISISEVNWTGPLTAECPYCGYKFKVKVR